MAGLIKREDIDEVRSRTDIKEVVDAYVTLKSAGVGSFKGLCPFHDERSPSFHVRPQLGTYHCFGCQEGGDVISFVQKMDHGSFTETVEKLAARIGFELHYEDGGSGPRREEVGRRQRLLDAHKIAAEFFREQLLTPGAAEGRKFLHERGFDQNAAAHFGVGFAPQGWDGLLKHLRGRGFTEEELKLTGMFSEGGSGNQRTYDRFRGRLIWPIRDIAGDTIGFGARKLFDEDQGPKYLNTPETTLYKKSQVLYGIDLAKRNIARKRQIVVVEGYTDVMACHLAGVDTAVATCGTAFGTEHIKVARRLLADDGSGGEVVFTFDGDDAGRKAALKAFDEDQRFVAQTYVAVEPGGADPCELRQLKGDDAVHALIRGRRPLFEFAIRSTLATCDLTTVEGRVRALRASAPVVAAIRDGSTRMGYSQELAGWLGIADPNEVLRAVNSALKRGTGSGQAPVAGSGSVASSGRDRSSVAPAQRNQGQYGGDRRGDVQHSPNQYGSNQHSSNQHRSTGYDRPDTRDPAARMEREALEVALQQPGLLGTEDWLNFSEAQFAVPAYLAVHNALRAVGNAGTSPSHWLEQVRQEVPEPLRALVSELAVTPLPASNPDTLRNYCLDIMRRLFEMQITRFKAEKMGALQRMDPVQDPAGYQQLQRDLMELEIRRRELRQD
ncbi:DNA primase [Paenarthrobacter sp. Z7-10]|uniref:DNA primase n=1 Tax=Paenarthrobacter sp. Z7-10 TaxID=2787635 RepID=UPI0022A941E6|nr:DNA primase [Paenarthrobacter sp. Z7-10]MCZ2402862.1 DNA primase [Paenarthrobacter sp. Z7-10]